MPSCAPTPGGPGIDNLLALTVHGTTETNTYFAITDHLGTIHALADDTGTIVESYRFDAWGNILGVFNGSGSPLTSGLGNRFLFQGREYSWATGLYNFRARWYDPVTGRWLSKDPIGLNGGLNQYGAFGNNPVNFRDPLGLCAEGQQGFFGLWGNALNNTVTAINQSMGQGLYDLVTWQWSDEQWNQISSLMWSTDMPAAPHTQLDQAHASRC